MILSDTSIRRPVLAAVISLLLVAFGLVAYDRLSLREYPNIDPPIVNITTEYDGASAVVIESRITKMIEDHIAGVEGIKYIESSSVDGRSSISIEFDINRDIDVAANDIRDRVSRVVDHLPQGVNPPEVRKVDGDEDVILWFSLNADSMTILQLTDFADRYLVDRLSILDGVARVRIGGGKEYAMRLWLDADAMAARGITVSDIETTLRQSNVELPAGLITMEDIAFTVRVDRQLLEPQDFDRLVIKGSGTNLVRLADVARVELGAVETRTLFRGNGYPMVGLGIIKQSTANTLSVAKLAHEEVEKINQTLPRGMFIETNYDSSVFIASSIKEVFKTLGVAVFFVMLVILAFLRNFRISMIPMVTVPVSLMATFWVLWMMGFSINILTLLALVLAIGLVVDDAIVVLENVQRYIEKGYSPLAASFLGARQVGFAVIATTLVLIAVFVPIGFLEGHLGRLFSEFALTLAVAVAFSSWVALTLSPVMASKMLKPKANNNSEATPLPAQEIGQLDAIGDNPNSWVKLYKPILEWSLRFPWVVGLAFITLFVSSYFLFTSLPNEYTPREDRGVFFILINGPEGASHDYMTRYVEEIEKQLQPLLDKGEARRVQVRSPRGFGTSQIFNNGIAIVILNDWSERRNAFVIMQELRQKLADLPGVQVVPVMRQGLGGRVQKPVQFVLGGGSYENLREARDIMLDELRKNNPGFEGIDTDYKETKPQLKVEIDYEKAGDLGVPIVEIGHTLEVLLGSFKVTTFIEDGEEYDIILEAERTQYRTPESMNNIFVRSEISGQLIPLSSLVTLEEIADSGTLKRYNRMRAITIEANLAQGYALGDALDYLNELARTHLSEEIIIDYKGQSRDFLTAGSGIIFVFLLGLLIVYLVMAAQFESFISPFIIMFTVPLAVVGGLFGLWLHGLSLNIYTQIGLIMLVGLATKNGILIVEFANQLRDQGQSFYNSIVEASCLRLRPILMTSVTAVAGAIPLVAFTGAGSETRFVIGIVLMWGISLATIFTLFVIPVMYQLLGKYSSTPKAMAQKLKKELS